MIGRLVILCASTMLVGCATHLSVTPDRDGTASGQAVLGTTYSLPMLQFDTTLSRSITGCPVLVDVDGELDGPPLARGSLDLTVKAEAKQRFAPGERYTVDFTSLTSPFRTSAFAQNVYPSGTLKGFNVSAEDKTDEVIKSGVKIGVSAFAVAGGQLPGGFLKGMAPSSAKSMNLVRNNDRARTTLGQRIETFFNELEVREMVVCRAETIQTLATAKEVGLDEAQRRQALADKLERLNKQFTGLAAASAARAATADHVDKAVAALDAQLQAEAELRKAKKDHDEAVEALSVVETIVWPRQFTDREEPLAVSEDARKKFEGLLALRRVRVPSSAALQTFMDGLEPQERAIVVADKRFEKLFTKDGLVAPEKILDSSKICAPDVKVCINSQFAIRAYLQPAPMGMKPCANDNPQKIECRRDNLPIVALTDKNKPPEAPKAKTSTTTVTGPLGRDARDSAPDRGLFIRDPGMAVMTICRTRFVEEPGSDVTPCLEDYRVYRSDAVSAPQFGQLRFLPFRTRTFEANELSLLLREDGGLERFEVKRTSASAAKLAAAVAEGLDQYRTGYEAQEKAKKEQPSAIDTQIAELDKEISLKTKEQALLKLQTPASEDKLIGLKEETLRLQTETALLNAQLARLKAEADLSRAQGGGQ